MPSKGQTGSNGSAAKSGHSVAPVDPAEKVAPGERAAALPPWQGPLPVLYKNPQILNAVRHAKSGMIEPRSFAFARTTNSVALGADELFGAQAYFPIVFTATNPPIPVAVLGVGSSENNFVDSEGKWRAGTYIPAYIRRYPFIHATGVTPGEVLLAVDEAAECFAMSGGRPLFEAGAPSSLTRQALEFCRAYQVQFEMSRAFGEALDAAGLLVARRADIKRADGSQMSLDGFRLIDEAKFDVLSDEVFLAWRRKGWLGLIYAQLMSMRRWQDFAARSPLAPA
jgi:hypothetical protein